MDSQGNGTEAISGGDDNVSQSGGDSTSNPDVDADRNEDDDMEVTNENEEDPMEEVKQAFVTLRENALATATVLSSGILRFVNVTVDIDSVQFYINCDDIHDLVYSMPEDTTWRVYNLVDRKSSAESSRLAMSMESPLEQAMHGNVDGTEPFHFMTRRKERMPPSLRTTATRTSLPW